MKGELELLEVIENHCTNDTLFITIFKLAQLYGKARVTKSFYDKINNLSNDGRIRVFSIDKVRKKIILLKPLTTEEKNRLRIKSSDLDIIQNEHPNQDASYIKQLKKQIETLKKENASIKNKYEEVLKDKNELLNGLIELNNLL